MRPPKARPSVIDKVAFHIPLKVVVEKAPKAIQICENDIQRTTSREVRPPMAVKVDLVDGMLMDCSGMRKGTQYFCAFS